MKHRCLKCEPCLATIRDLRRRIRLARARLRDAEWVDDEVTRLLDLRRPLPKRGAR